MICSVFCCQQSEVHMARSIQPFFNRLFSLTQLPSRYSQKCFTQHRNAHKCSISAHQRGETALHMAARAGQMEVVRCLLRNGALVDAMARVSQLSPHQR